MWNLGLENKHVCKIKLSESISVSIMECTKLGEIKTEVIVVFVQNCLLV